MKRMDTYFVILEFHLQGGVTMAKGGGLIFVKFGIGEEQLSGDLGIFAPKHRGGEALAAGGAKSSQEREDYSIVCFLMTSTTS